MEIRFTVPSCEEMLESILQFQTEGMTSFWQDPLYEYYPQLGQARATAMPFPEREAYLRSKLTEIYQEQTRSLQAKAQLFQAHWNQNRDAISAAFADVFGAETVSNTGKLACDVSLNPIQPRYLAENRFELCYLQNERYALSSTLHELTHFLWFAAWQAEFRDDPAQYEAPSLIWLLSEAAVDPILCDERLLPFVIGQSAYSYFYTMEVAGIPLLQTLREMYETLPLNAFMKESFAFFQAHEAEIRSQCE